jgi:hypothetical protein
LAIITMQTMPTTSWTKRVAAGATPAEALAYDIFAILPPALEFYARKLYHSLILEKSLSNRLLMRPFISPRLYLEFEADELCWPYHRRGSLASIRLTSGVRKSEAPPG